MGELAVARGRFAGTKKPALGGLLHLALVLVVVVWRIEVCVVERFPVTIGAILDHHVAKSVGCAVPCFAISSPAIGDGHVAHVCTGLAPGIPGVVV